MKTVLIAALSLFLMRPALSECRTVSTSSSTGSTSTSTCSSTTGDKIIIPSRPTRPTTSPTPTNQVPTIPSTSTSPNSPTPITNEAVDQTIQGLEQSVFNQINQYRASQGLPALTRNSSLDNQARTHSINMSNGSVAFGHDGFSTRLVNSGLRYTSAGENVAYNQGYSDPATQAVQGWLKSPGHLANIRGNYSITGVGIAKNSQGQIYFTQIFMKQ